MIAVPRFGLFERSFDQVGIPGNPYTDLSATVTFVEPDGVTTREGALFWDGAKTWRFRFSPNQIGTWQWSTHSRDSGLDGHSGAFDVVSSPRKGSIRPMTGYPHHFERQDGSRFWFLGDTAWSLYVDSADTQHDRAAAEHDIDVRASQGFNVIHSMLLHEEGWINCAGVPFGDGTVPYPLAAEQINPAYWQEVDRRLAYLNNQDIVAGLVLAWGRKKWDVSEPFAWDRFSSLAAQLRYARYVAARYSAYDVYWIVAGEWNASSRDRGSDPVRQRYVQIGDALRKADPHRRMIAIHPGTHNNHFCREFNDAASWMDFGDYQQNYTHLHAETVASRKFTKPVVNSEYAYYLRDADQDGLVDKPNSQSLDVTRHATWDIVFGGGYVVSGFGSTYMGGARNAGPFDVDAPQNDDWEAQIQHIAALFQATAWWRLEPRDDLLIAGVPLSEERQINGRPAPPLRAAHCLTEPGEQLLVYARGMDTALTLSLAAPPRSYSLRQFDPRSGEWLDLGRRNGLSSYSYHPPDDQDWVILLQRTDPTADLEKETTNG